MLVGEEDVEGDELPDEVVSGAVAQVPDAVHRRRQVRPRRVHGYADRRHPPGDKGMRL